MNPLHTRRHCSVSASCTSSYRLSALRARRFGVVGLRVRPTLSLPVFRSAPYTLMCTPPSTGRLTPVMIRPAGEQRKAHASPSCFGDIAPIGEILPAMPAIISSLRGRGRRVGWVELGGKGWGWGCTPEVATSREQFLLACTCNISLGAWTEVSEL